MHIIVTIQTHTSGSSTRIVYVCNNIPTSADKMESPNPVIGPPPLSKVVPLHIGSTTIILHYSKYDFGRPIYVPVYTICISNV